MTQLVELLIQPGENLLVQSRDNLPEPWIGVTDFSASGPNDKHFTLDDLTGELRLGPAIQQQHKPVRSFGEMPPPDSKLIFEGYCCGGSPIGNVQAGVLNTLKTSIPYVDRVINRQPAEQSSEWFRTKSGKVEARAG